MKKILAALLLAFILSALFTGCGGGKGPYAKVQVKLDEITIISQEKHELLFRFEVMRSDYKLYGYLDENGNVVIAPVLRLAEDFKDGLAVVGIGENKNNNYINMQGELLFEKSKYLCYPFNGGSAVIYDTAEDQYSIIDNTGKFIKTFLKSTKMDTEFSDGLLKGTDKDNATFFVDAKGATACSLGKDISAVGRFNDGLVATSSDGETIVYYNKKGTAMFKSLTFDRCKEIESEADDMTPYSFTDGFARIFKAGEVNGRWGLIDTAGNITVPIYYQGYPIIYSGRVFSETGTKYIRIFNNTTGDAMFDLSSGKITQFGGFYGGIAKITSVTGEVSFIDRENNEIPQDQLPLFAAIRIHIDGNYYYAEPEKGVLVFLENDEELFRFDAKNVDSLIKKIPMKDFKK